MKKIIVLFNGINAPWHITTFALNTAKQHNAELDILFLKDERRKNPYPNDLELTTRDLAGQDEKAENEELEEKNIKVFKAFCDDENVRCHFKMNISLEQLIDLSLGADLIVTNSHDNLQRYSLRDILSGVNCPVCLISVNATEIKKIILLYDGSDDASYAITNYKRLFPNISMEKNFLVTVNEEESMTEEDRLARQELDQKFSNLEVVSLSGDPGGKIVEFIEKHTGNTMVVMGAYGRSAVSRLFKPSLANLVLEESRASLFIAHD